MLKKIYLKIYCRIPIVSCPNFLRIIISPYPMLY